MVAEGAAGAAAWWDHGGEEQWLASWSMWRWAGAALSGVGSKEAGRDGRRWARGCCSVVCNGLRCLEEQQLRTGACAFLGDRAACTRRAKRASGTG